jgi:hypothetical protein
VIGFPDVDEASERLYTAFARHPLPASTSFCDHCVTAAQVAATRARPLHLLTAEALHPFMWHSLSTWGDETEFKHFLPRVLELIARDEVVDDSAVAWGVMNKVSACWLDWPDDERAAIEAFSGAWWRATLTEFPRRFDMRDVLESIGVLNMPIAQYLAYWETLSDEAAARHLAWLVGDFSVDAASNDEWYEVLDRWIEGPAVARLLDAATSAASTPEVAAELRRARAIHDLWPGRWEF